MSTQENVEKKGKISIHTENIFPIIKKWLYSDHEIFLRELISNGFDAITKLQKLSVQESIDGVVDPKINVQVDKDKKTVTFSDTGLGLDAEEVEKYIAQVAFSSAEEFVEKFKDQDDKDSIIGRFGLGFYSAFMVADKVEILSKSYRKDATAILWACDGSTDYTIVDAERAEIGTDIILHINDDSSEYLEDARIQTLVKKYMNFLPVEVQVNGVKANDDAPLWVKMPADTKEEDYKSFYQKMFPFSEEPLFWIHLNIDYPFNLKGILFFPKVMHELDATKGQVKLFCKQVFVSDNSKEVIPEFLTLLQGAIDCPDIPLNVSRSYLQNDPYVQKISKHIIKKVADKLTSLYKKDKEDFVKIWDDISPFVKYGMMQSDDFYQKVKDIVLFESSTGETTSLPDYLERNKEKNENKVLYCADKAGQATYVQMCKDQGLEVVYLHTMIDTHFIQFLESKNADVKYVAVDSEVSDTLVDDGAEVKADGLVERFKKAIGNETVTVEAKALKSDSVSGMMLESEMTKRMKTMSHFMKGAQMPGMDAQSFVINVNSPLVKAVEAETDEAKAADLCLHVYDLARLSKQQLSGEDLQAFIARSNALLSK